jgi:tRNA U38,U39,U40 pseudouridine synthase TruA
MGDELGRHLPSLPHSFAHRSVSALAYKRTHEVYNNRKQKQRRTLQYAISNKKPEKRKEEPVYLAMSKSTSPEEWDEYNNQYLKRKEYGKELGTRKLEAVQCYRKKVHKERVMSPFEIFKNLPVVERRSEPLIIPLHDKPVIAIPKVRTEKNNIGELYEKRRARTSSLADVLETMGTLEKRYM